VEQSTNARLAPAERVRMYGELLQLPLPNAASRIQLTGAAGKIAEEDFAGNWRKVLEWTQAGAAAP
jgi:hypothetical protein